MTKKVKIATGIVTLFYVSGFIGMAIPESRDWFLTLTPLNLLVTAGLYLWANDSYDRNIVLSFVTIFLIGFFVEVVGVKTGLLFGTYKYGAPLGWKLWEVPLTIGINWFLLALSSYAICKSVVKNNLLVILFASLIMTLVDVLIEPVAIALDFWSWELVKPPLQNYAMWFMVSAVIHTLLCFIKPNVKTAPAYLILASQIVFFGALLLVL